MQGGAGGFFLHRQAYPGTMASRSSFGLCNCKAKGMNIEDHKRARVYLGHALLIRVTLAMSGIGFG